MHQFQPEETQHTTVPTRDSLVEIKNEAELRTLECSWYEGHLMDHVGILLTFIAEHRQEILEMTKDRRDEQSLMEAAKSYIIQQGSLHSAAELRDQVKEIHAEIWIRGKKGDHDRRQIQQDWTAAHAAAWRRWRLKEYLFVAARCSQQIAVILTRQG